MRERNNQIITNTIDKLAENWAFVSETNQQKASTDLTANRFIYNLTRDNEEREHYINYYEKTKRKYLGKD